MELLSQKVVVEDLTVEIKIHDLSYRMGFRHGDQPTDHLYVTLTARDFSGRRIWTTHLLRDDGKIKPFSTVAEALSEARARIGVKPDSGQLV